MPGMRKNMHMRKRRMKWQMLKRRMSWRDSLAWKDPKVEPASAVGYMPQ